MKSKGGMGLLRAMDYFLRQGFKNIWRHRYVGAISAGIVAVSLFLFGVFMLLQMNLTAILDQVQNQCEINVYLAEDAGGSTLAQIETDLKAIDGVRSVRYRSKEERLEEVRRTMYQGKESMLDGLEDDNPLRDSYVLETEKTVDSETVSEAARSVRGVSEVTNLLELEEKLKRISAASGRIGYTLLALFALAALFIMANTIRIAMAARSREIEIMRFVGASSGYICGPFVVEGILLGILGAMIAALLILCGYRAVLSSLTELLQAELLHMVAMPRAAAAVIPAYLGLGAGIGALGSAAAVRKYLKV